MRVKQPIFRGSSRKTVILAHVALLGHPCPQKTGGVAGGPQRPPVASSPWARGRRERTERRHPAIVSRVWSRGTGPASTEPRSASGSPRSVEAGGDCHQVLGQKSSLQWRESRVHQEAPAGPEGRCGADARPHLHPPCPRFSMLLPSNLAKAALQKHQAERALKASGSRMFGSFQSQVSPLLTVLAGDQTSPMESTVGCPPQSLSKSWWVLVSRGRGCSVSGRSCGVSSA